jgi:NTP pyrophosphatase (non-canonical NTP hydrolase)
MTKQIDLNKYQEFVQAVTSTESNSDSALIDRLLEIGKETDVNLSLLMTAAIGLAAETGEFAELPKKVLFQGKALDEDTIFHMKRELGDVMWYWINACRALNLDPNDVIQENIHKLESRYPGGEFDAFYSENRKTGDL